jgi:hypothetical protein
LCPLSINHHLIPILYVSSSSPSFIYIFYIPQPFVGYSAYHASPSLFIFPHSFQPPVCLWGLSFSLPYLTLVCIFLLFQDLLFPWFLFVSFSRLHNLIFLFALPLLLFSRETYRTLRYWRA